MKRSLRRLLSSDVPSKAKMGRSGDLEVAVKSEPEPEALWAEGEEASETIEEALRRLSRHAALAFFAPKQKWTAAEVGTMEAILASLGGALLRFDRLNELRNRRLDGELQKLRLEAAKKGGDSGSGGGT